MAMQNSSKTSITQRFDRYQPSKTILVWACVVTAVATIAIGFNWDGRVTGGWATMPGQTMADSRSVQGCVTALSA
ncbi:hypothetical protein [Rhizobium binxianense]